MNIMRSVSKITTGSIGLLFLGFVLFLAIKSFPSSQANKTAYPGPVDVQATPLSPEALCEQWFSFRQAFSAEKRAMLEEDYKNCVNARLTPSPAGVDKRNWSRMI